MILILKRNGGSCLRAAVCGLVALGTLAFGASDKRRNAAATPVTPAAVSPANSFDAFQLVVERNIFNPNRVGRTKAAPEEKPPRVDEISLVGTMNYDKGLVAFFDSTDSAYKKTLHEGESVAGYKVQHITADGVELTRDDKTLSLKVAQQLRRVEAGEWTVRAVPITYPSSDGRGTTTASGAPGPEAVPEIPADASEALKRLMERRNKQLK